MQPVYTGAAGPRKRIATSICREELFVPAFSIAHTVEPVPRLSRA
jgi:hypothetical protein